MRFIVHVSMPVTKFNEVARSGNVGRKLAAILEDLKPEAAYFTGKDGKRGGYLIVDMASAADMPRIAEPWFLTFDATVEFSPVMTPADLQQAGLEALVKKWG
jgi:hypothetical protein